MAEKGRAHLTTDGVTVVGPQGVEGEIEVVVHAGLLAGGQAEVDEVAAKNPARHGGLADTGTI